MFKLPNTKILAQRTLEQRETGVTYRMFFRRSLKQQGLFFLAVFLAVAVLLYMRLDIFVWLIVGMYLGAILRDIGWVLAHRLVWPYTRYVIDWDKVQRVANGEPIE